MKFRLTHLWIIVVVTINYCYGQGETTKQDRFKPFTLLLINPDGAEIADTLQVWADSIEKKYIDRYHYSIKTMESMREWGDEESKRQTDIRIQAAKMKEMAVHDFKYYHTVTNSTLFELGTLFNTDYWEKKYSSRETILEGDIIDRADLFTYDLGKLGKHYKVDYIVTFDSIRTDSRDGIGIMKFTATLFSTKRNKIILEKEIEGNAPVDNYKLLSQILPSGNFHESGIHCDNYLECMFKSAVRFSTEELFNAISQYQKK
jgi:hypothetical protein